MALPAVVLSGADVASIAGSLSQRLAESLNAPLPAIAATVTQSMACVIVTGTGSVARIEVQGTRSVVLLPSIGGPVPTAQTDQIFDAGVSAPGSYSLPDSRRAEELIGSARRALRVSDIRAAREEGGKLEGLFDEVAQGQISPNTLIDGYQLLCDIEFAVIQQGHEPAESHLARAEIFLERAKHVPST